jgi:hypothetical protein
MRPAPSRREETEGDGSPPGSPGVARGFLVRPPQGRKHPSTSGRLRRRCRPRVRELEDRTLLTTGGDVLAGIAIPIVLGTPTSGALGPGDTVFYAINATAEGRLVAQVHAQSGTTRLSLLNGQGQVLMQSDGQSLGNPDNSIDVHVPAGPEYLEIENLGSASAYSLTTELTQASAPFQSTLAPTSIRAWEAVTGDFNGDGRLDLATADFNAYSDAGSVSVFLGNGDGTFQPPAVYAVGNLPLALAAGDFTGDGRTDLAVANALDNDVSVLLGNGDGTFQAAQTYAAGSVPDAIVAGDFTGDGRTDLAVANRESGDVSVLLSNADGTFQNQVTYDVGREPYSIIAGDFADNGRIGLATANFGSNDVSVLLGNGDGTFQNQVCYAAGPVPYSIVAGDFTGNGRTDLAVATNGFYAGNNAGSDVSVLLANGDGTVQAPLHFGLPPNPGPLFAGDFNGDGRLDLAVGDGSDDTVSIFLGNGDGTFKTSGVPYPVGGGGGAFAIGDFNGDGRLDFANASSSDVAVLQGNGDGTFQTAVAIAAGVDTSAIVSADFNGDGRPDLAVAGDTGVSVLLNNGDGTFQTQVTYPTDAGGSDGLVAGDFNGDGRVDLATANYDSNDVSILLGNGDGTFQAAAQYPVGTHPYDIVAADFNGDGRLDLAVSNEGSNDVSLLLGNGDGTFQPQVTYSVEATRDGLGPGPPLWPPGLPQLPVYSVPHGLVSGDFNGDGRPDLAVADSGANEVTVLLNDGHGAFQNQVAYPVGYAPNRIVTGDFNGDGRLDLATANYGSNDVSVLLGNGDGTFQAQARYSVATSTYNVAYSGSSPFALVAGDFNGDGRLDLAAVDYAANFVSVLAGNGDGTFQNQVTYAVGVQPVDIVAGDFSGDGRLDLAVANRSSHDVSLLLNLNGSFVPASPVVINAQPTPLVADLTGDGTADVLVLNRAGGILLRKGRPDAPGTFDPPVTINPGNPSRDIAAVDTSQGPLLVSVDATDDAVSLYAWRDGGFVVIGSLPTGTLPAQIATADLNGDGWADLVVRNAGDGTLSVFLNNGSGGIGTSDALFLPSATLPVGAGVSDVTLADVDGDGATDIVVTISAAGEVGVLRNLDQGAFAPVVLYGAGSGPYEVANPDGGSEQLTTLEATAGVAAGAFTAGGPPDLLAIDPGSNTFSVLSGLGGGRFANPVVRPTARPAIAVRVADLEGNGIPDAILLSASGVTVYRGDGKGGFLPDPFTIDAGPDPTGLTVTDINHDGKPDLLVSNAHGDLLVLLGNGDGTFQPYYKADQQVALAVLPNGSATPDFIYADQGLDRVVVDYSEGQSSVLGDSSSGLLAPGAVQLADLNGDGIPDLIVANSGSNDVLVYPGLGNGQFGPELNGGHGFFTGTDPVSITVATLNGRPDLVIANKGSNDVSILLNEPAASGGFTFVAGPRLRGGTGPTSTVVQDVNGDGIPDLLVSDSGSNQVRLLPGVGGGFFNDQNPTIYSVGSAPNQVLVGTFTGGPGQGPQVLTVNQGSNDVTLISNPGSDAPVIRSFPTGGTDPVAALGVSVGGSGLESLIVANSGDGVFSLLGGTDGLGVEATVSNPALTQPSALALAAFNGDEVSFYATTAGVDTAFALAFILPVSPASNNPGPGGSTTEGFLPLLPPPEIASVSAVPGSSATVGPAQLLPLNESANSIGNPNETALPLVGTLVTIALKTAPTASPPSPSGNQAELSLALLPGAIQATGPGLSAAASDTAVAVSSSSTASSAPSLGQSLPGLDNKLGPNGEGEVEPGVNPVLQGSAPRIRVLPDLDEVLDQIREEQRALEPRGDEPEAKDQTGPQTAGEPIMLPSPPTDAIDEAIHALWAEEAMHAPPVRPAFDVTVALGMPLVLSGLQGIRARPLVVALRGRRSCGSAAAFSSEFL